jgi:DNA-binding Lrp family transcriptional regulator
MSADEILEVFARRRASALFVTELAQALHASPSELNADLERLSERGNVLLADHPVPDPHLSGIDLRIVAPLPADRPRADAEAAAAAAAETLWNKWLATFLSSHRCQ